MADDQFGGWQIGHYVFGMLAAFAVLVSTVAGWLAAALKRNKDRFKAVHDRIDTLQATMVTQPMLEQAIGRIIDRYDRILRDHSDLQQERWEAHNQRDQDRWDAHHREANAIVERLEALIESVRNFVGRVEREFDEHRKEDRRG